MLQVQALRGPTGIQQGFGCATAHQCSTLPAGRSYSVAQRCRTGQLSSHRLSRSLDCVHWDHRRSLGFLCNKVHPKTVKVSRASATEANAVSPFQSIGDLAGFIGKGPLLRKIGLTQEDVDKGLQKWIDLGLQLCKQLNFDPSHLNKAQQSRIFHYYLPTFFWCQKQLDCHRTSSDGESASALMIGISAPQGCGKSTLVEQLELLFRHVGSPCAGVSIDDFYLTAAEQTKLAAANSSNKLLQYRGNAGSHDLELGQQTLRRLQGLIEPGASMLLPRYDKSAGNGRGDRAPESSWPRVEGPLQVVLFEGWMLGFKPVSAEAVKRVDPHLVPVNEFLGAYHSAFDCLMDAWIVVQVSDPNWVYKWRLQAEEGMRAKGKPGMTNEQVADFCDRFMPAYRAYLPGLYSKGPTGADPDATLNIGIDESRNVRF